MDSVFANGMGDRDSIPGWVIHETQNDCTSYHLANIIRYVSRVKWSNPGKGVTPSSTPRCWRYWTGSLWVSLDCHRQLYLCTIFLYRLSVVESNPKAPFSIATTPRCRVERFSIPWIPPLYPWCVPYTAEC